MGKAKRRQYIENLATSLIGQLRIDEGAGLEHYEHDIISGGIRVGIYEKVLIDIRHMNEVTLAQIVCCGEAPAVPKGKRDKRSGSTFWDDLQTGRINCPLDHVHYALRVGPPEINWLAGFEEKSGLEILRHVAATVIVAAMYDVMNKRKNARPQTAQMPAATTEKVSV